MTVSAPRKAGTVGVMVVDDSPLIRGMLGKWLAEEPGLDMVAAAGSAEEALCKLPGCAPDVCVLDVELPGVSGVAAIPQLLAVRPGLRVLIVSSLTSAGAATSLRALEQGASDCMAKPQARDPDGARIFRAELMARLRALGERRAAPQAAAAPAGGSRRSGPRPAADLLVIGASTGGPPALGTVLSRLAPTLRTPVMVVQHMPATFTPILARNLAQQTGLEVEEATEGAEASARRVLIAPGGRHLRVVRRGDALVAALDDRPPVNFCRPAVDPLFESAAQACGERLVAAVLTGMGSDGREGARAVSRQGGYVVAQDEASSVVWGMPGAVVAAGLADAVEPLARVAERLAEACGRGAR